MTTQASGPATITNIRDPRFLLMYAPQHFPPEDSAKPDGSLGLLYLAGALRRGGYDVTVLDACIGNENHSLQETFFRTEQMSNGLIRIGMSPEDIAKEILPYDVIGITSMFTVQTSRVIEVVQIVKRADPQKLVLLGGLNSRHQISRFLAAGADLICLSEAESTILEIGAILRRGSRDFSGVAGIAFMNDGRIITSPAPAVEQDLDKLAMPAWDLVPLARYWELARPHGGGFKPEDNIHYGSMMTSRGCPFRCEYCHISKEGSGSPSGDIRRLRLKSKERVLQEIDVLKALGVQYVFLEDDSLLAKKDRAIDIFHGLQQRKLTLSDVNGVNITHMCRSEGGKLVADEHLMTTMAETGFAELTLPFESGSQRILNKYGSHKLNLERTDTKSIIRTAKRLGMTVGGNYIFGYPDETYEELTETILLAKKHMDEGMDRANMMCVVPYPGTNLYDIAIAGGHLSPDFDPDKLNWLYPTMVNTIINPDVLRYINKICWLLLNKPKRINAVMSMAITPTAKMSNE